MTGKDMHGYYSTTLLDGGTNTPATVSWTRITRMKDGTLNDSWGEADASSRDSNVKEYDTTLRELGYDFSANYVGTDAAYQTLRAKYLAGEAVAFAFADGMIDVAGTTASCFNGKVFSMPRNEELEGKVTIDLTIKPAIDSYAQDYIVAAT